MFENLHIKQPPQQAIPQEKIVDTLTKGVAKKLRSCKRGDGMYRAQLITEFIIKPGTHKSVSDDPPTCLHVAVAKGKADCTTELLKDKSVDIDALVARGIYKGMTALHIATLYNYTHIIKLLLDKKAQVNARDNTKESTALHLVSQNGNVGLIKLLLARGAQKNVKNLENRTPLQLVVEKGNTQVVALLKLTEGV